MKKIIFFLAAFCVAASSQAQFTIDTNGSGNLTSSSSIGLGVQSDNVAIKGTTKVYNNNRVQKLNCRTLHT